MFTERRNMLKCIYRVTELKKNFSSKCHGDENSQVYFGQILSQNIALCLYLPRKLNKKPSILIFLAPKLRKMCPPLLKTCSWVITLFNSLWRQRLTSVALPCVLTQDYYRRLRNLRRVFLRLGTVFSFWSIRGFISFGKWRTFLTVRCKNWCEEISAYKLVNKLFKVVFLALLAGVQNMREIMLIQ